jgi:glycosyltransferase involved in cell wall biosynthesis
MKVSLILPIYNEQLALGEVLTRYIADLKSITPDYEIIAVNDGSSDGSGEFLLEAARLNRKLRVINLDGRFGKQAAINAGMEAAKGDCVILADVTLRNPLGILKRVYGEITGGENIVYAYREREGADAFKNSLSNAFTRFAIGFFGVDGRYTGRAHVMAYTRSVIDVLVALPNKNKLLRTMDNWVGWNVAQIEYPAETTKAGAQKKEAAVAEKFKKLGQETPQRSRVREHTASQHYAYAFVIMALIVLGSAITMLAVGGVEFMYHFFAWLTFVAISFVAVILFARAAVIKRVGIIHCKSTTHIYTIKNVIN